MTTASSSRLPNWLLVVLLGCVLALLVFSYLSGRPVYVWGKQIGIGPPYSAAVLRDSTVIPLRKFDPVLRYATEVLRHAENDLVIVIDTPAYGVISVASVFPDYEAAFKQAADAVPTMRGYWLPYDVEREYLQHIRLDERERQTVLEKSQEFRDYISRKGRKIEDLESVWLGAISFWVAEDRYGDYYSVLAWVHDVDKRPPVLHGVYSRSKDFALTLENVYAQMKASSAPTPMEVLLELFSERE